MKLKRTSLLFDKSIKALIEENPDSPLLGIQEAMKFINNIVTSYFLTLHCANAILGEMLPIDRIVYDTNSREHEDLSRVFIRTSRIASVISIYHNTESYHNGKHIEVHMNFYDKSELIYEVRTSYLIETGEPGGVGVFSHF